MIESARLAPPYSIEFIEDIAGGEVPDFVERSLIAATASCIMVCTQCEDDGETEFRLGSRDDVDPGTALAFRGRFKTPSRKLVIRSVLRDLILELSVPQDETTVSIWGNHPTEPDQVIIGVE